MPAICQAAGIWDAIGQAPYVSKQEWQAANLLILCQILVNNGIVPSMSACTVDGLWNQIKGNPPFLSDQEFYAENLNLLCQLLAGGGGGGGGVQQVYSGSAPPAAPANPALPAIFYPTGGGAIQEWSGAAWI